MGFNSSEFLFFILFVFAGTLLFSGRSRIIFFTLMSYVFYSSGYLPYLLLLFASTLIDYIAGFEIGRSQSTRRKKSFLILSVTGNLLLLGAFKYLNFFEETLATFLSFLGMEYGGLKIPPILLPVGISFYTFQSLSYTFDIYRGKLKPVEDFISFACFVSFFPQLIAGPIVRARQFLPQIPNHVPFTAVKIIQGIELVLLGFFKKLVIADNCAKIIQPIFHDPGSFSGLDLVLALFIFSIQIYCDFSGYSDIARGLAKTLGFELPVNFRWPYFSRSITEFWRRWHMTLSFWLRDYIYKPLGGSYQGKMKTARNILIVWLLCGLWHGAGWNFFFWGGYFALLLIIEKSLSLPISEKNATDLNGIWALRVAITFCLVALGWVLFRAESLSDVFIIYQKIFSLTHSEFWTVSSVFPVPFLIFIFLVCCTSLIFYRISYDTEEKFFLEKMPYGVRIVVVPIILFVLSVFGENESQFIYFNF